jgi:hypothetical protein
MVPVLANDSYRGLSAEILLDAENSAQPLFVGRVLWPEETAPEDVVVKLYQTNSCGIANETIGYVVNALRGIRQPRRAAILVLSKHQLPTLNQDLSSYIDPENGLVACWITSFEQNSKPFRYLRKLSSFSKKQCDAFYKSAFCSKLATVDHVTGNNDRHEGNFLYEDDLKYFAIDQGSIGGGIYWHTSWPDANARNELAILAQQFLSGSQLAAWRAAAIMEYEKAQTSWESIFAQILHDLKDLLGAEEVRSIVEYMRRRATGPAFASTCERLI